METTAAVAATETTDRHILLDRINTLIKFDRTGADCDEAMALMRRHQIGADELNARAMDPNRPHYRCG